jgi:ADP-ribosylglycohydrolase
MSDRKDRVRGVLLGLAAGDRIGGPLRMALMLCGSLLARRCYDEDEAFGYYLAWWREGGFDTGPVAGEVFRLVTSGVPRADAVRQVDAACGGLTAGCNPAHRSPPLAMAAFLPAEQLADLARRDARLTHRHPVAGDVAAATVALCARLIAGERWEEVAPDDDRPLSDGGFAPDVFRAAVHFVGRHDTFADALAESIRFAGPSNYCPVLVGAIGGARGGASSIPVAHLAHCDILDRVSAVADAFAEGW